MSLPPSSSVSAAIALLTAVLGATAAAAPAGRSGRPGPARTRARDRRLAGVLGAGYAAEGVQVARVLSSRWCRALDTATIAFGHRVEQVPALDSFFDERGARESRTEALRRLVEEWSARDGVLVLVTHQVNVTALTGSSVGEGEVLVLAPRQAGFTLVGTIRVPPS